MRTRKQPKLPTVDRLGKAALHYLERYASSSANLRKVLERKVLKACAFHERDPADFEDLIDVVVAKCERAGLINDQTYAETKTAGLRRRGASRRKIEAHLTAKGVGREIVEAVLSSENQNELHTAFVFARRRRLGPFRSELQRNERRDKDMAAICRAGYSFDIARKVVDSTQEELSDFGFVPFTGGTGDA